MTPRNINDRSKLSFRIEALREQKEGEALVCAHGTGFLWTLGRRLFLVTNVHNLTGWNYEAGRPLSENGATPTHVRLHLRFMLSPLEADVVMTGIRTLIVPLSDDAGQRWLVHPEHRERADVAVLEVNLPSVDRDRLWTRAVNGENDWTDFEPMAGDEAFVLGFPLGLGISGLPVWKRASIATDPAMDYNGLPILLLDTATRQGMSGSPVLAARRGLVGIRGESGLTANTVFGLGERFLGVYSGRIGVDELGAQLAIVWKGDLVAAITDRGVAGKLPWD